MSPISRPPFGRSVPGNRWDLLEGERPDEPPLVSVIVAHYQQQAELDRTLAALQRQTHPADRLEVIVVDDGSPDAPAVPRGVRLLRQEDDGFRLSAARNLGVSASTGSILCFLDADTAPEPDYVERMVRLPSLLPEAVTVGRRKHARLDGVPADVAIERVAPTIELPEPQWLLDEYSRSGDLLRADHRSYRFIIGAVTACSRWFFDQVGGYDETFREYGGEDWEWAHRAWLDGAVFAHVADAVAWHDGPDWAGRDDAERRRRKNAETLRTAARIPVTGSRGYALHPPLPDVLVRLETAESPTAAYIAVDTLLAALPVATVVVPDEFAALFGDQRVVGRSDDRLASWRPRVVIGMPVAVRLTGAGAGAELADAVEAVGTGALGTVVFETADGSAELTVASRRASLRRERWGESLFDTEHRAAPWARTITEEPGLAAYLGGWG
ncbi:MAG: glycosyltransferase [Naasia sp.]